MKYLPLLGLTVALLGAQLTHAQSPTHAVWQWSTEVEGILSPETKGHPRAFLWIPPSCERLRGVVIGQHNMEEEMIFEHPTFRETLAELNFAVIWITPPLDFYFRFDLGNDVYFEQMLQTLAQTSGYEELARVPVVPLGHSAAASFPWYYAAWAPERTLAAISVSGQWPDYRDKYSPDWGDRTVDGVPGLVTMGEYENAYDRSQTGLRARAAHPMLPLSMLAEPAGEHFAATDEKIAYISLYLRKAAEHRLPDDWPINQMPVLKPIDPTTTGWLADRGRYNGETTAPAAPVGLYTGDPNDAFWYFDEDLARATEEFGALYAGRKLFLLGYVQDGEVVPQRKSHIRVGLKPRFIPEADGLTFKLSGTFLDTVNVDWRGLQVGDPIGHPEDASLIEIKRICGPVKQIGPDTFQLAFNRVGFDNWKRSGPICFLLTHPGDENYRPMSLESVMPIHLVNKDGSAQHIRFTAPGSVRAGTGSIELTARSDQGLPVQFYVREGPAYVEGNTLHFTEIPARAKSPIAVTIVAWQWGRSVDPKVQSATPVEKTIQLVH